MYMYNIRKVTPSDEMHSILLECTCKIEGVSFKLTLKHCYCTWGLNTSLNQTNLHYLLDYSSLVRHKTYLEHINIFQRTLFKIDVKIKFHYLSFFKFSWQLLPAILDDMVVDTEEPSKNQKR